MILEAQHDLEVVGEATDVHQPLGRPHELTPDIVLRRVASTAAASSATGRGRPRRRGRDHRLPQGRCLSDSTGRPAIPRAPRASRLFYDTFSSFGKTYVAFSRPFGGGRMD